MALEDEVYHDLPSMFEQNYRCYSVSFIEKSQLEKGDKILMPPSALDRLATLQIDYPMLFELRNPSASKVSHCGVLEFIAEEGLIYIPYWMMENLLLQEGDIVNVKNASLLKGTYVKLQPHTTDFLDISNPKAILETSLRSYSCLTTGDTVMVSYNNKKFYIDIIETKPSAAISIIETDCEVDFAPPLDYKEPERPLKSKVPPEAVEDEEPAKKIPKFNPFSGSGRRLDGKLAEPVAAPLVQPQKTEATTSGSIGSTSSNSVSRKHSGKLVFGSNADQNPNGTPKHERNRRITQEGRAQIPSIYREEVFSKKVDTTAMVEEGCATPNHDGCRIPSPPPPKKKRWSGYGSGGGKKEPPKNGYFRSPEIDVFFARGHDQACV